MIDRDELVRFQACNPKRRKTAARERYEKYEVATTIGDALKLGATVVDITYDLKLCFAMWHTERKPPHKAPTNEAAKASSQAASCKRPPSSAGRLGLSRSTDWAATASLHAAPPKVTSSGEGDDKWKGSSSAAPPAFGASESDGEELVIIHERDTSAQSSRTLVPNTDSSGSGREASAILIHELRAQLQAGQKLAARRQAELEHVKAEATSMKRIIAELQHDRDQKKEAQLEDAVRIRSQVTELALKACSHVESRTKSPPGQKLQYIPAWVEWMAAHIPTKMLQQHHPRVLAALVLHSAWCMEWGEGFPFAKGLVKLVE